MTYDTTLSSQTSSRAGILRRAAAYLIDLGAITALTLAIKPLVGKLLPDAVQFLGAQLLAGAGSQPPEGVVAYMTGLANTMVSYALVASIYFLSEGLFGRALGKLLLGMRVESTDGPSSSGARPRLIRYLAKNAGALLLLLGVTVNGYALFRTGEILIQLTVLGFLVAIHRRRQALHDLLAGTTVFRRRALEVSPPS